MKALSPLIILTLLLSAIAFGGTTGKIVGTVTDTRTGEKLLAANVVIEGMSTGASTNVDGFYTILNVPPGRYKLKATLVGYTPSVVSNVKVDIDQTTTINISLSEETVQGQEVVIVAQRPVVQKDVAASRTNIEISDVDKLPVSTVSSAVGLQAGIESGLVIRAGGADQVAFMVDGLTLRDERTNAPYTNISLMSVQDIQVQTGGFNAEYGNIRSGVVNVVTKEGNRSGYSVGFNGRYSPARPKHFGSSIYDANSYWMRPYLDPAVAYTGTTNGAWDTYTQRQYPSFEGWNSIALKNQKNTDGTQNLSPKALQQLFEFQHRRIAEIEKGDYDIDATLGGPIPILGSMAGNTRFFGSYRQSRSMYLVPLSEDSYRDYNGSLKITSDLSTTMKLTVEGLYGRNYGTNSNNSGLPGIFISPESIGSVLNRVSYIDTRIFATDYWAPTTTNYWMAGVKLSNTISANTFYDASFNAFTSQYSTNPGRLRDTSRTYLFGNGYYVNEGPIGFDPTPLIPGGLGGLRMGIGFSNSRDTSLITTYTGKFDVTSQLDRINQVKAGVEFVYTDNNVRYGLFDAVLPDNVFSTSWHRFPIRGALYVQDKLEFEGMIANLGVRVDYQDPGGTWYQYDPYNTAFTGAYSSGIDTLLIQVKTKKQTMVSPRLGIAFPISDNAKLFFNYGHFRQMPTPDNLFQLRRSTFDNSIARLANPNVDLPRTVAYELGYEHSLFDEYLLRVAAYYKDVNHESRLVNFANSDGSISYSVTTDNAYEDIRGFELTMTKNRGNWVQGFINYTYDVQTYGYFGLASYFQNQVEQALYVIRTQLDKSNFYQQKPIPQPYARLNLDFFTPQNFFNNTLLDDWRLNLVGRWSSGYYFTWGGGSTIPGVSNNVQWADSWNFDMRLSKNFKIGKLNLMVFADVTNLFNYKYMTTYGFSTGDDFNQYMKSLHLPDFSDQVKSQIGYVNVPGDDRPGAYRKDGVDFQPIEAVAQYSQLTTLQTKSTRPYYYAADTRQYYQWTNNKWQQVDPGRLQQVLDDKAYIDMPNQDTFSFLNPRDIYYGIRLSFDL